MSRTVKEVKQRLRKYLCGELKEDELSTIEWTMFEQVKRGEIDERLAVNIVAIER